MNSTVDYIEKWKVIYPSIKFIYNNNLRNECFCCGCFYHNPEIYYGDYDNNDLLFVAIGHEIGHLSISNHVRLDLNLYEIEFLAWVLAETIIINNFNLKLNDKQNIYKKECLQTYERYDKHFKKDI